MNVPTVLVPAHHGTTSAIPATALYPGEVLIRVLRVGEAFRDPAGVNALNTFRQPPFAQHVHAVFGALREALNDQYSGTVQEWEDAFRRDAHPIQEICTWLRMAIAYCCCTRGLGNTPADLKTKREVFSVILIAVYNRPENIHTKGMPTLSRKCVTQIVARLRNGHLRIPGAAKTSPLLNRLCAHLKDLSPLLEQQ